MQQILRLIKSILKKPPFRQFFVLWRAITASWHIYLEKPVPTEELKHAREAASLPSFGFFFLLITATVIATNGLLVNSSAVIIGAMIIAPLMNPILSMAFGIVTGDRLLYQRSIVTVALGALTAIFVSYLINLFLPIELVGSEIIARTSPNLIDLVIAIAAGAAGSFSLTRKSIASSIAGVAIAVALVPPLCVTGIGLGIGSELATQIGQTKVTSFDVATGSFLLFLANLAGITFTACLVFLSQSYGGIKQAIRLIRVWFAIIALLSFPLSNSFKKFVLQSRIQMEIERIRKNYPEIRKNSHIQHIGVRLKDDQALVTVTTIAHKGAITDEYVQFARDTILDSVSNMGIESVDVVLRIVPVNVEEYRF